VLLILWLGFAGIASIMVSGWGCGVIALGPWRIVGGVTTTEFVLWTACDAAAMATLVALAAAGRRRLLAGSRGNTLGPWRRSPFRWAGRFLAVTTLLAGIAVIEHTLSCR